MAVLDRDIEILMLKGEAATITVGEVETGEPGSEVEIVNSGTTGDAIFDFKIPRGDKGESATIKVGKVETGEPGSEATVTNSGTEWDGVFDFKIPRGDKGDKGDRGEPGSVDNLIWGDIKGTLTDQTDLVEYIDNKLASITDGDNVSY